MHSTSTSLKLAAGALAVAFAVFGLTGCGSRGSTPVKEQVVGSGTMSGSSSAQFDVGHAVE
jgi:hypothetical protein